MTRAPDVEPPDDAPYRESPWWPYLSAHVADDDPKDVLGGPLAVQGQQEQGTVNWVLPGKRTLDPAVFGTADNPEGAEQPAMLVGVPPPARETADGDGQRTAQPTPFSDKAEQVEGSVDMTLIDATATDAATTEDRIDFEATFTSPDGADYRVVVERPAPMAGSSPPPAGWSPTSSRTASPTGAPASCPPSTTTRPCKARRPSSATARSSPKAAPPT